MPVLLQAEGNVLRWETLDDNGAEIIQLIISFKRYLLHHTVAKFVCE